MSLSCRLQRFNERTLNFPPLPQRYSVPISSSRFSRQEFTLWCVFFAIAQPENSAADSSSKVKKGEAGFFLNIGCPCPFEYGNRECVAGIPNLTITQRSRMFSRFGGICFGRVSFAVSCCFNPRTSCLMNRRH